MKIIKVLYFLQLQKCGKIKWSYFSLISPTKTDTGLFRLITLTSCPDTDFTCMDGTCVTLDERCDGNMNCDD